MKKDIISYCTIIVSLIVAVIFASTEALYVNYQFRSFGLIMLGAIVVYSVYKLIKGKHQFSVRSLAEIIDYFLTAGWSKQLLMLSVVCIITFLVCWGLIETVPDLYWGNEKITGHRSLWLTICYFFDPGNLSLTNHNTLEWQSVVSMIVAVLGMTILTGLFISTFTNIIEQRVKSAKAGLTTYKSISGHYVVIGHCELTESVIRGIFDSHRNSKVILLTNTDIKTVKQELHNLITAREYQGQLVIYSGDYRVEQSLQRLNLPESKEIYILGDDHIPSRDYENLACWQRIEQRVNTDKTRDGKILLFVRMDRIPSFSTLQRLDIPTDPNSRIEFRPFNYYEHWARLVWIDKKTQLSGADPVDYSPLYQDDCDSDKYVHLVISGFSQMGMALTLFALRNAHYENYSTGHNKTRITVIDPHIKKLKPQFEMQYPHLEQIYDIDIEYRDCMFEEMASDIAMWSQDCNQMLTIAICINDDDIALSQALNMPLPVYYQHGRNSNELPKILVRQKTLSGIWNILRDKEHDETCCLTGNPKEFKNAKYNKYINIRPFGMKIDKFVPNKYVDIKSSLVNFNYTQSGFIDKLKELVDNKANDAIIALVIDAKEAWLKLSENMKWANRYQVYGHDTLTHILASRGITTTDELKDKALKDLCCDVEHRRWVGERVVSGWQQTPLSHDGKPLRNNSLLLHTTIVDTSLLDAENIENDLDVVENAILLDEIVSYLKDNNLIEQIDK